MEYGPDIHLNHKFVHEHDFSSELMTGSFYPSLPHKRRGHGSNRFTFFVDGTAEFKIIEPEQFPELASFKGTWEETYLMLAKHMKENWPQEPLPEELEKILAK